MNMRFATTAVIIALASLIPLASAGDLSIDLEAGYQWVSVNGNQDMYRTQVNQDDGFVLRDFSLRLIDPEGGALDSLRIDAAGFGGDPSGRFRFETGLGKVYRLRLTYQQTEYYSALPGFANPFAVDGIVPGQHTYERDRQTFDLQLELLPGRALTPIVGYRWNRLDGPRRTTYHVGQDEFRLDSDLEETEQEVYVGLSFATHGWVGSLIQGWRNFEGVESLTLAADGGDGNNLGPVLGRNVTMDDFERETRTEADTPVTTFHVTGPVGDAVRVRASYVRADSEAESSSAELLSGSLVSYRISRFFGGFQDSISSETESPSWRGAVRVAIDLNPVFNIDVGIEQRHRSLDGWAMISSLYLDTMTFGGLPSGDITDLTEVRSMSERDEEIIDLRLNFDTSGPFKAWAGASISDTDLDLSQDAAQIVVPGSQDGSFEREITKFYLGSSVSLGKSKVLVDLHSEEADHPVVRTDFTDRVRMRARIEVPIHEMVDLGGTAEYITADNLSSGVGFSSSTNHYALDLGISPTESTTLRFIYDTVRSDSHIPIRRPEDFVIEQSVYAEDATVLEGQLEVHLDRFGFDAGYSVFENDGTFELKLKRLYTRLWFKLCDSASAALEYESYDYSEDLFSAADFDSDRIGVFIRFRH